MVGDDDEEDDAPVGSRCEPVAQLAIAAPVPVAATTAAALYVARRARVRRAIRSRRGRRA